MFTFLRKIRTNLVRERKINRYILYAIGEILLVMIGILLALQVNNWNEERKERLVEQESYRNLLTSLRKDSIELAYITDIQNRSFENMMLLTTSSLSDLTDTFDEKSLNQFLMEIDNGSFSFFPKYGTYNMILSNNGMDIIQSAEIKSMLIEYYDYQCKRYENIDQIVDRQFALDLHPFLHRNLGFFNSNGVILDSLDLSQMKNHYVDLVSECRDLQPYFESSRNLLLKMQEMVQKLILFMEAELSTN
jgi:hypothetical protein